MSRIFMPMMLVFGVVVAPFTAFAEDFDIHYELNGGTSASSGMPTTYTAGVETIIDGVPTRANSGFAGWCVDSGLTDCAATQTILDTDTGDKTFYASWTCKNGYGVALDGQSCTANQYNVTYDCGTGTTGTPPATAVATYDADFNPTMIMKNSCERSGYVLSGWVISGTNTVQSGTFKWTYTTDKTLTAQWVEFDPKFTITTTNMSAGDTFKYWQGSDGLFYVDWGDGTLQTINYRAVVPHTYETAGVHTIRFDGLATGYDERYDIDIPGAVSFGIKATGYNGTTQHAGTPLYVAGISGSLGAIYRSLANGNQPRFISTFNGCTNLTGSIPAGLFSGVSGTAEAMFFATFARDAGIVGYISPALFAGITGSSTNIFSNTFLDTSMDTECPCGVHSATTAWGVSSIDSRAVCEPGLKPNEHYYTGDNGETACTTDCDFATTLKTKTGDTEGEYPIVSDKVTTPALVLQSGGTTCYVPLETGVDTFNLMWGQSVYHAGRLDEVVVP